MKLLLDQGLPPSQPFEDRTMHGLTYEATVVNGLIRLPADVQLPENARVLITVPAGSMETPCIASPRLADPSQAADFAMTNVEIRSAGV